MTTLLRFDVVTLFPEYFETWSRAGVCGRAVDREIISLRCWNPRDFTSDAHQTVDDRPYGGGPGMVMMAAPLSATVDAIVRDCLGAGQAVGPTVLMSPAGEPLTQSWVEQVRTELLDADYAPLQMTLICGRYEGIDQRFCDQYVDELVSVGDVVLSGGEIAAMAILDALTRRLPGVLGDEASSQEDSFMNGLLDHPHYTRPENFEGAEVPEVLLSGHHGNIAGWRREQSLLMTALYRPDLIEAAREKGLLSTEDESLLSDI